MLFDTSDARQVFRPVVAQQRQARAARARRAPQQDIPPPTRRRPPPAMDPLPPLPPQSADVLRARQAMQWLGLGPTPFYMWRNWLGIRPVRKGPRLALYTRQDLLRIHAAYLAHTRTREVPHDS